MNCLRHHKSTRSTFHATINILREDTNISVVTLRELPRKCCFCHEKPPNSDNSAIIDFKDESLKKIFAKLIELVEKKKSKENCLIKSLNHFIQIITENQPDPHVARSINEKLDCSKASQRNFVFLPFRSETKTKKSSNPLVEVAEEIRLRDFLRTETMVMSLSEQLSVELNLINSGTDEQIKSALNDAMAGSGTVEIHDRDTTLKESLNKPGRWVLVQLKEGSISLSPETMKNIIDILIREWEENLEIEKRPPPSPDQSSSAQSVKRNRFS